MRSVTPLLLLVDVFIGHIAVGFAAKGAAPRTSLGALIAASLLPDLIWPLFLLAGWESVQIDPGNTALTPLAFVHYPISHSLLTTFGWAVLAAAVYQARARCSRGAIIIGLAVISHWLLDALVHKPDLPIYPGSHALAGLRLWDFAFAAVLVEVSLFVFGLWMYARISQPPHRGRSTALWIFAGVLLALYAANVAGPPPPNANAVALTGLATWILPLWAGWLDRRRTVTPLIQ